MSKDSEAGIVTARSPRWLVVAATLTNAAFVLSVQLIGLVALAPADFGLFSLQYLVFALASSVCLSVICEPWLRTDIHDAERSPWRDYSSILLYLSFAAGGVAGALSIVLPGLPVTAIPAAIAVAASVYRAGARYHQVRSLEWTRALISDVTGLVVTFGLWAVLFAVNVHGLLGLTIAWAVGACASAAISRPPVLQRPSSISTWIATHRRHIWPLLKDSTLMDLGSIGTPFVVAPLLGIADFGVYRAVSNVAAPVRLVLNPIRPTLAGIPLMTHRSRSHVLGSAAASIGFGVAAYLALIVVGALHINLGSLSAVVTYAVPTAIFVSANFIGHYYYIIARTHMHGSSLLTGRIIQTAVAVVLPIAGALAYALPGAIWSYAIATCISSLTWAILVTRSRR